MVCNFFYIFTKNTTSFYIRHRVSSHEKMYKKYNFEYRYDHFANVNCFNYFYIKLNSKMKKTPIYLFTKNTTTFYLNYKVSSHIKKYV